MAGGTSCNPEFLPARDRSSALPSAITPRVRCAEAASTHTFSRCGARCAMPACTASMAERTCGCCDTCGRQERWGRGATEGMGRAATEAGHHHHKPPSSTAASASRHSPARPKSGLAASSPFSGAWWRAAVPRDPRLDPLPLAPPAAAPPPPPPRALLPAPAACRSDSGTVYARIAASCSCSNTGVGARVGEPREPQKRPVLSVRATTHPSRRESIRSSVANGRARPSQVQSSRRLRWRRHHSPTVHTRRWQQAVLLPYTFHTPHVQFTTGYR